MQKTHLCVALPFLALGLLSLSCAPKDRDDESLDGGGGGGGDDGADDGADDGDGDGDGGGQKFDVAGGSGDGGDNVDDGCDKVDFLFVVDNSGSMEDEQIALIASFPQFIGTIRDVVAQDYHVMAVSTDNNEATGLNSSCTNGVCTCTPAPVCCQNACGMGGVSCNGFPCDDLPIGPCDFEWGSGKKFDADGNFCDLEEDRRWFTHTQPDLENIFSCVAHVGTYGSGAERPMQAMMGAVSADMNTAGGCNEGFLRNDAILVVVIATDEEDDAEIDENGGSPGNPPDWAQALVDAKNGDPSAVVVLMLVGDSDVSGGVCPPGADPGNGTPGAEASPRLREFAEIFEYGMWGSICEPSYGDFFNDAISVIDVSCEEFTPPG
jgi:hypothetical protein